MDRTPKTITRRRLYATWMHRAGHELQTGAHRSAQKSTLEAMAVAKRGARKAKERGDKQRLVYWLDRMVRAARHYDTATLALEEAA